ncbi:MAG: hypothetical protein PSV35_01325, partial [bacterium]|nr:hypothetical protein [bacterium]
MSRKNIWDIYSRNAKGFFIKGFPDPERWTIAWFPAAIVFLATSPLTLILGVGIKSLIDFFSRKEIPERKISSLSNKIQESDANTINTLVEKLSIYQAQSTSSKKLIQTLHASSTETIQAITKGLKNKKEALQEEQFNSEPSFGRFITVGGPLSQARQNTLENYNIANSSHCNSQKLKKQKDILKEYLGAEHNSGKKMQQIIYDHFFFTP